jgi:hypothetical protein
MTGTQLRMIRRAMGLNKLDFAIHIIGYTGSDQNVENRIHRLEGDQQIPLHLGRFVHLIWEAYNRTGKLPHWPANLLIEGETPPWM